MRASRFGCKQNVSKRHDFLQREGAIMFDSSKDIIKKTEFYKKIESLDSSRKQPLIGAEQTTGLAGGHDLRMTIMLLLADMLRLWRQIWKLLNRNLKKSFMLR